MKAKTQSGKNHYKAIYGVFPMNSKQNKQQSNSVWVPRPRYYGGVILKGSFR